MLLKTILGHSLTPPLGPLCASVWALCPAMMCRPRLPIHVCTGNAYLEHTCLIHRIAGHKTNQAQQNSSNRHKKHLSLNQYKPNTQQNTAARGMCKQLQRSPRAKAGRRLAAPVLPAGATAVNPAVAAARDLLLPIRFCCLCAAAQCSCYAVA